MGKTFKAGLLDVLSRRVFMFNFKICLSKGEGTLRA